MRADRADRLRNPPPKGLTLDPVPWNKLGPLEWLYRPIVQMKHLPCAVIFYLSVASHLPMASHLSVVSHLSKHPYME
jgi:hypothetical protein